MRQCNVNIHVYIFNITWLGWVYQIYLMNKTLPSILIGWVWLFSYCEQDKYSGLTSIILKSQHPIHTWAEDYRSSEGYKICILLSVPILCISDINCHLSSDSLAQFSSIQASRPSLTRKNFHYYDFYVFDWLWLVGARNWVLKLLYQSKKY